MREFLFLRKRLFLKFRKKSVNMQVISVMLMVLLTINLPLYNAEDDLYYQLCYDVLFVPLANNNDQLAMNTTEYVDPLTPMRNRPKFFILVTNTAKSFRLFGSYIHVYFQNYKRLSCRSYLITCYCTITALPYYSQQTPQ